MAVDPSKFSKLSVIDTCSIWNLLSSKKLYHASSNAKCHFSCTQFVFYECLHKPRKQINNTEVELKNRLEKEINKNKFVSYHISIEDLHELEILENRKKLSKGELSSIVFAKKTGQAFITDDQKARKLAECAIDKEKVQTIPQLFGWLIYSNHLSDCDKDDVINEHCDLGGPLSKYFEKIYIKALELKLAYQNS